jgi:hypothetical protein
MISLGGLVSQKAFGKFEMGKVISNPFANAFIKEGDGEDHEVSMANNSIDTIIKMATELKAKMGEDEKQIPAWIQDHIAKAENLISQASGNYHEYGDSNESVSEASTKLKHKISKKEWSKIPKYNKHIGMDGVHYIMKYDDKIGTYLQGVQIVDESVNEAPIPVKDGKYHFYYKDGVGYLTYGGKEISSGDYDMEDGSNAYWMSHSSFKGSQKAFKTGKDIVNYFKSKKITTESVNEASPCWKGYKQVGMKDKGGRQVPNCVPNESVVNEAPNTGERIQNLNNRIKALRDKLSATKSPEQKKLFQDRLKNALQTLSNIKKDYGIKKEISSRTPKIFVKTAAVEKKIRELMADRKKAVVPYNTEKDPDKKEKLKQILIKLTQQIQGYEKNLIQLRDMEEEYLQQMHADAELDTSGL